MNMCIICHKEIYLPWNRNVNRNKPGHVYLVQDVDGLVKIGITTDIPARLGNLRNEIHKPLTLLASAKFRNAGKPERELHLMFKKFHSHGEWFSLDDKQIELAKEYLCRAK